MGVCSGVGEVLCCCVGAKGGDGDCELVRYKGFDGVVFCKSWLWSTSLSHHTPLFFIVAGPAATCMHTWKCYHTGCLDEVRTNIEAVAVKWAEEFARTCVLVAWVGLGSVKVLVVRANC